jgi:Domain of unknown function (DUF4956)
VLNQTIPPAIDYADLAVSGLINLVAILAYATGIYFRRHARKDLAVVYTFFNLCLFVVVVVIQMTEVAAALGFGLFAILSIIRLRSEPFDNRQIGYFFGALVIGLVNGIGTPNVGLTLALNALIVVAAFVLDHPGVLRAPEHQRVTLDIVHTDPVVLHAALEERLAARVLRTTVHSVDFVRDVMELEVQYVPLDQVSTNALPSALAWMRS